MIYTRLSRTGEIVDVKAHGGGDISEVYGGIGETNPIYYKSRTLTGSTSLSFKGLSNPLSDYLISGNTVQDGTPTPDSPIMPNGTGERTGNLFDKSTLENGIYLAANGNKYGNVTNGVRAGAEIKAFSNTAYTLSVQSSANVSLRIFEWSNGTFIKQTPKYNVSGNVSLTVTTDAETTEIAFNIEGENAQYATNIMLNLGSTALPYEPYGYKLPLTVNGTEHPIYLGQVETTRRIKKLVLTGKENWNGSSKFRIGLSGQIGTIAPICTHYRGVTTASYGDLANGRVTVNGGINQTLAIYDTANQSSLTAWKSYLAAQYAAGTPITVWYVLAEPRTSVVNEPLHKIGDYADTITMAQTGEVIPTTIGTNTLTVDTTVQPSEVSITGNIKPIS